MVADVVPIQLFILTYLYFATVRFFALPRWAGALAVVLFMPYAALVARGDRRGGRAAERVGRLCAGSDPDRGLRGRAAPARAGDGAAASRSAPASSRRRWSFARSTRRSAPRLPIGTHFLWHLLNGVMLGWMIVVLLRHEDRRLADARLRG